MVATLFLLAIPSVAQANAGSSLMGAGMFHLVIGNLLIGVLEGILLAKVFDLSKKKCIGLLIPANYFSVWFGGLVISGAVSDALPWELHNAWMFYWLMVLLTYVITLVLEFPFVALAFRGDPRWRRKSVWGSLLVQTVSYILLFGWYWWASGTSLYTKTDIVELSSISLPEPVLVYFISVDDGDVYAGSLTDADWYSVFDLNSATRNDRLFIRRSSEDTNSWDLVARLENDERSTPNLITIKEQFASVAAPSWRSMNTDPPVGTWFNFGQVPKLGDAESSSWEFWSGFWPSEGLFGTNSGGRVSLSLETPFVAWAVRNATLLPGDKVLLQLGDDQICVYDPERKQIALLTHGRGPIAVKEEEKSNRIIDRDEE